MAKLLADALPWKVEALIATALRPGHSVILAAADGTYTALLAPEGVETSDGRMFDSGSLGWREQVALTWSPSESAHDDAVIVGNIVNLRFEQIDSTTWAVGTVDWDISEPAAEAKRLVDEGRENGVSVHLADYDADMVCRGELAAWREGEAVAGNCDWDDALLVVSKGVIAAATLVLIPAFEDARVVVASAGSLHDFPIGDRSAAWDATAADGRWREQSGSDEEPSASYRDGFLWFDAEAPGDFGSYKLQVVDVVDGETRYMPRAIFATAGGRGVNAADIPAADKSKVKRLICSLYDRINASADEDADPVECPFSALTAAIDAGQPSESMFAVELSAPTRLTVEGDRVFGHLALWDTCHRGFPDICVTPPRGSGYDAFHDNARIELDDGTLLTVGCLTMDTFHAPSRVDHTATRAHYEHSGTVAAWVRAGEDEFGVWVAGIVEPSLSVENRRKLGRMSLSGDWRTVDGKLSLIAAQAVPVPGFPIRLAASAGEVIELITTVELDEPLPEASDPLRLEVAILTDVIVELVAALLPLRREAERTQAAIRSEQLLADLS